MTKRVDYKSDCCGARVLVDAYAVWNPESQSMELQNDFDARVCEGCGDDCESVEVDLT